VSATLDRILFEERHRTAADAWGNEHPPVDGTAEAALLNMLVIYPEQMATLDLGARLCLPEHRTLWQVMTRVWMRDGRLEAGLWSLALYRELHVVCNGGRHLGSCSPECCAALYWDVLCRGDVPFAGKSDIDYWLDRLDRCVEARRLIEAAQFQAACAWRGDLEEACWAAAVAIEGYSHPVLSAPVRQSADRRRVDVNVSDLDM
jgi:hypothetical protein